MILTLALIFLVITLGSIVRKGLGFGDAILTTPIMLIFLDQLSIVTPLIGLTTMLLGLIVFYFDGSTFKLNKEVIVFFLISFLGLVLGSFLLNGQYNSILKISLAFIIIVVCSRDIWHKNKQLQISTWMKRILAFLSGLLSILFNMPGPAVAMYFREFNKKEFRSTLSVYFLLIEPLSSIGHYSKGMINNDIILLFILIGVPASLVGVLISLYLANKFVISNESFRKYINRFLLLVAIIILSQSALNHFEVNFKTYDLSGKLPLIKDLNISIYIFISCLYSFLIYLIIKKRTHLIIKEETPRN